MIGDSYEVLFHVRQIGLESLSQIENEIRKVDAAGKSAGASIDHVADSSGKAAGSAASLKASLTSLLAAIQENTSSNRELTSSLDGVSVSAGRAGAGLRGVGAAARGVVPEVAAASGALRTLEGAMPIRAAERFLTSVLGLGPALQAVFPLVGAAAFGEILGQMANKLIDLYEKWDPVLRAQRESLEILQQSRDEMEGLVKHSERLRLDQYKRKHGRPAREQEEAKELNERANARDQNITNLKAQMGPLERILGVGRWGDGPGTGRSTSEIEQAKARLDALNGELLQAEARRKVERSEASDLLARAAEETGHKIKQRAAEITSLVDGLDRKGLTPLAELLASTSDRLQAIVAQSGKLTPAEIARTTAAFRGAFGREAAKTNPISPTASNLNEDSFQYGWQSGEANLSASKSLDNDYANPLTKQADAVIKRAAANAEQWAKFQARIVELTDGPGGELEAINKVARLREDSAQREFQLTGDRGKLEKEIDAAREDRLIALGQLQKKQIEEFRNDAGQLFDALRGGGSGVQRFFQGQFTNLGRQVFVNATAPILQRGGEMLGGLIPGQVGTDGKPSILGTLLHGTIFDSQKASPEIASRDKNTAAIDRLTGAMTGTNPATGVTSANSPLSGIPGLGTFGSDTNGITGGLSSLPGVGKLFSLGKSGTALGDFTGALGRFAQPGQGFGAVMDAFTGNSGDDAAQRIGVVAADKDAAKYSGHSCRSGFVTSACAGGASLKSIMRTTGHKSLEMPEGVS
jgi:hypothetical protein